MRFPLAFVGQKDTNPHVFFLPLLSRKLDQIEAEYITKETSHTATNTGALSGAKVNPPAKRVRSKGRAASVPNFGALSDLSQGHSQFSSYASYGANQDHSGRSCYSVGSNDSEAELRHQFSAFEILQQLTSTSASFSSASYHAQPHDSSISDLGFTDDGHFNVDASIMDSLFESYDYELPGIDLLDGLEGINAGPFPANSASTSSSAATTPHHMPLPGQQQSLHVVAEMGRTTRSHSCPLNVPTSNIGNAGAVVPPAPPMQFMKFSPHPPLAVYDEEDEEEARGSEVDHFPRSTIHHSKEGRNSAKSSPPKKL